MNHLTAAQIRQYHALGYVAGPRVLDDVQIDRLKSRIEDILARRVELVCLPSYDMRNQLRKQRRESATQTQGIICRSAGLIHSTDRRGASP